MTISAIGPALGRAALVAVALLLASTAQAQVPITLEPVGLSLENELYAVKVLDMDRGNYFSVRKLKSDEVVKEYPYEIQTEEKIWKQVVSKHGLSDELVLSQASPKDAFTIMGAPAKKGPKYNILVSGNGKVGLVHQVDLEHEEEREQVTATGMLKQVAWDKKGKWLIVIVNQKLGGSFPIDRDYSHSLRFRSFRVQWGKN